MTMFQIATACCVLALACGGLTATRDKMMSFDYQESPVNLCLFACSNCFDAKDPQMMVECANTVCLNALPHHNKLPLVWIKACQQLENIWPKVPQ